MKDRMVIHYSRGRILALVFLLLLGIPRLEAQTTPTGPGGAITGKVLGPGNVPVPGARVILFNVQTRSRKETWTGASGNYGFTDVSPGQYRVVVLLIGFRPSMLGPTKVVAGKSSQISATLALAQPGEPTGVGIFAGGQGASQLGAPGKAGQMGQYAQNRGKSGGSAKFQRAGGASAMGNGGATSLADIVGSSGTGDTTGGLQFSQASGGGSGSGGTDAITAGGGAGGASLGGGSAGASNSFVLTGNTVDATAPAMQRGGPMRYRRFGGGGPAGSPFGGGGGPGGPMFFLFGGPRVNRFHGNLFDNYSNSAFNARPYALNTPPQAKEAFYREQVGVSLGGPLIIPKIYNGGNKTSFFIHFNTTRATTPYNILSSVPTQAERNGDFSQAVTSTGPSAGTVPAIYEPSSTLGPRTAFRGNVIPTAMLNPASAGLLKYIPLPDLPGEVQNYHVQGSTPMYNQMIMGRIGQQFSAKDNMSAFYFYLSGRTDGVGAFPDITSTDTTRFQNLSLTETHTFSPRLVNMLSANFNRARNFLTNPFAFNQNIEAGLGIAGVSQSPIDWGLPAIGFTNFSGLSDSTPSLTRNQTLRFSDYVMVNLGKHNFQIGTDISKIQLNTLTDPNANGTYSFTGYGTSNFTAQGTPVAGTGYDFADFLLGLPQTTSERFGIPANYLRSSRYDIYGNDDWRMTNHFTLDLGGRWEYAAPFTEKYGHLSDLALGQGFSTVGVVTGQNAGSLPTSLLHGHASNVAPRIGIAYRPWISHSLVVRAGYGIFYDESIYQNLVTNLVDQPPFATTNTLVTNPAQVLTIQNGFPAVNSSVVHNTYAVDPNFLTPYAQSWNVMLEQDLSPTIILSVAYIGTRGTYLNLLEAPNVAVTSSGQTLIANAQPFEYDTSGAESIYNGLRVSLRHFSRNDFSFFLNYTYSKSMDDASSVGGAASEGGFFGFGGGGAAGTGLTGAAAALPPVQDPFNLRAEWALSGFNATHSLRAFTRYQLPFGDRKHFLSNGGTLAKIFGNWDLSNITSFSSGMPLTAFVGGNASNNVNGIAPFGGLRADATGLPASLSGGQQNTLAYFNTAAFALPLAGQYGNAGRNTIPGPPSLNFNMGIDRIITISREKGMRADFRLQSSNTFNIVNYSSLATTINSNTFGRVLGVGPMRSLSVIVRFWF